jgi:hypothetical protein
LTIQEIIRILSTAANKLYSNTPLTTISMNKTEPDLGLFGCEGDDVSYRKSMSWKGSTHGYSPFFQVSNLKNKVMDASGDRITSRANG